MIHSFASFVQWLCMWLVVPRTDLLQPFFFLTENWISNEMNETQVKPNQTETNRIPKASQSQPICHVVSFIYGWVGVYVFVYGNTGDKDKTSKCVFVSLFSLFIESISNVVKTLFVLLSREHACEQHFLSLNYACMCVAFHIQLVVVFNVTLVIWVLFAWRVFERSCGLRRCY